MTKYLWAVHFLDIAQIEHGTPPFPPPPPPPLPPIHKVQCESFKNAKTSKKAYLK